MTELQHPWAPTPSVPSGRFARLAVGAEIATLGQFVVGAACYVALSGLRDDYGVGFGGGLAFIGLLFLGPILLVIVTLLHWALFTLPVLLLTRLCGRPRWAAVWIAVFAALYAAPVGLVAEASYVGTWAWIAAAGVFPVATALYAHRRRMSWPRMLGRVSVVTGIGLCLSFAAAVVQFQTGWGTYEPPHLERSQYAGEWTDFDGARLVLRGNGTAEARNLSVEARPGAAAPSGSGAASGSGGTEVCSGTGTWSFRPQGQGTTAWANEVREGVALTVAGCPGAGTWQVAGTDAEPELFRVYGDPDDGDVQILHRG